MALRWGIGPVALGRKVELGIGSWMVVGKGGREDMAYRLAVVDMGSYLQELVVVVVVVVVIAVSLASEPGGFG